MVVPLLLLGPPRLPCLLKPTFLLPHSKSILTVPSSNPSRTSCCLCYHPYLNKPFPVSHQCHSQFLLCPGILISTFAVLRAVVAPEGIVGGHRSGPCPSGAQFHTKHVILYTAVPALVDKTHFFHSTGRRQVLSSG